MPTPTSPELAHYLEFFERFHERIGELIAGLSPEALDWRPLVAEGESTNSLAVLVTHLTGAQQYWVGELVGRRAARRDRDSEFVVAGIDEARLRQRLDDTLALVRAVLSTVPAERLDERVELPAHAVTLRWAVVHALEHTALHVGHMQITRQLWQARQDGPGTRQAAAEPPFLR
jgi:uncharacterized damage-inducible protein DinB